MGDPIALKFGTGRWCKCAYWYLLWLEYDKYSRHYLQLFTKNNTDILSRVNHEWQEAENWYRGRLIIEPQTLCGLKEMELKTIKIQRKNQCCVIIPRSRITNKMPFLPNKPLSRIN